MPKAKTMKIVHIQWLDAVGHDGWRDPMTKEACEPVQCETIGFLLHSNKKFVTVVQSMTTNGHADRHLTIPRCCVTRIQTLKL